MSIRESAILHGSALEALAAQYATLPSALQAADPRSLKKALKLAEGNERRIAAEEDGSLIVWNRPVW